MGIEEFKERRRPTFFGYLSAAIIGAVIGGALLLLFGPTVLFNKFQQVTPQTQTPVQTQSQVAAASSEMHDTIYAANKVMPAVVGISTIKNQKKFIGQKQTKGVGSGVIVDKDGYILTNNHVADINSKNIIVYLYDGREVNGKTVWADPLLDLAIVKIDENNLNAADLGEPDIEKVGEIVIAIGNPLGLNFERTVTAGIISAKNRTIQISDTEFMEDLIQTDASINPGNSGGPLVNTDGQVIGINTIKVETAEGIGFAVPVSIMKPILASIKEKGDFKTPIIGIKGFDRQIAGYFNYNITCGIYVYSVDAKGSADEAGVKEGDIILSVNGTEVNTMLSLKQAFYTSGVGSTVKIRIKTPLGTMKDVQIKLEPET